MRLIWFIKRQFCTHTWKIDRFQALVGGWSYSCEKCRSRCRIGEGQSLPVRGGRALKDRDNP